MVLIAGAGHTHAARRQWRQSMGSGSRRGALGCTGTGTLTVIARHGHVYARDYGVLCDDSNDDAAELATAIADTPEAGTLELPAGICRFSSNINLPISITLQGQGMGDSDQSPGLYRGTVIRSTASIGMSMGNPTALASIHLRDLVLLNPAGPGNLGIAAGGATYGLSKCVWRNVLIAGWAQGLQLGVTGTGTIVDSSFHGVYFRSNTTVVTVGTGSTNNTFYGDVMFSTGVLFANLANPFGLLNSTRQWCQDCSYGSNPCLGSGNGAWATRSASLWKC